jgi:hypothetical protein
VGAGWEAGASPRTSGLAATRAEYYKLLLDWITRSRRAARALLAPEALRSLFDSMGRQ